MRGLAPPGLNLKRDGDWNVTGQAPKSCRCLILPACCDRGWRHRVLPRSVPTLGSWGFGSLGGMLTLGEGSVAPSRRGMTGCGSPAGFILGPLHAGSQTFKHYGPPLVENQRSSCANTATIPTLLAKSRHVHNQFSSLPTCQQISYEFGSCLALTAADPKGATRRWEQPPSNL